MATILASLLLFTTLQFAPLDAGGLPFVTAGLGTADEIDPFAPGWTVEGVVIDAGTSAPLGGAMVEILGTGKFGKSSREGKYSISDVPAGTYDIRASAEGYVPILLKGIVVGKEKLRPVYCVLRKAQAEKTPPPDFVDVSTPPQVLSTPQPKYAESARKLGVGGTIWLKAIVDQDGSVDSVVTLRLEMYAPGDSAINTSATADRNSLRAKELYAAVDDLVASARETLRQWTFTPAVKEKKNVSVWVTVPFRFKLSDEGKKQEKK